MKNLLLLLITLLTFTAYPQEGMVLIDGYSEQLEDALIASKFDYEKFPEIDSVVARKMPRRIRGQIVENTIILNNYYKDYPNLYRVNYLYMMGKYYGLKPQKTNRIHVMSEDVDVRNEHIYKFRRSRRAEITTLIRLLEEYKPLKTK